MEALDELASALRGRLIDRARSGKAANGALEDEVRTLVESEAAPLPEDERRALGEQVLLAELGSGLSPCLSDPRVDEVMVNGPDAVYVERGGRSSPGHGSQLRLGGRADARDRADPRSAGRRVDEASPLCDARLPDGSRVNVVIPPLSLGGACLTIRRFRREGFSLRDLVAGGTLSQAVAELLAVAVAGRASVLVSGGTGSGRPRPERALGRWPGASALVE